MGHALQVYFRLAFLHLTENQPARGLDKKFPQPEKGASFDPCTRAAAYVQNSAVDNICRAVGHQRNIRTTHSF